MRPIKQYLLEFTIIFVTYTIFDYFFNSLNIFYSLGFAFIYCMIELFIDLYKKNKKER